MNAATPHRRLVLFCGPQHWGKNAVAKLISSSDLPDKQIYRHQQGDNALGILGQDRALVIINAYEGLNPDVIGRVSGTIVAGGALAIICPHLADWPDFPDPQATKLIPYPGQRKPIKSHYLQRWSKVLSTLDGIECYTPSDTQSIRPIICINSRHHIDKACTADQQAAIDALIKSTIGQRRRPVIITADRGRGKSAAMGLTAANLITTSKARHIIITSSGFNKVRNLFKHAHAALTGSLLDIGQKSLQHNDGSIRYVAPEALINGKTKQQLDCDLLLVDEAASLGVASLEKLLIHFSRIAFASTEHGYEGSGRGFSLKFKQLIDTHCRGYYSVELETPIRWADQDPLERWINQLLLLKANDSPPKLAAVPALKILDFEPVSQQTLVADEDLLQRVIHLLIDAHYQTRPLDLRYLLDAPNSQLWLARADQQITGLVWLMHEGGLDQEIAGEIVAGRRRPQGHLVPQIMAAHIGLSDAVTLNCARIQRIVVDPSLQNKGIGSWMLDRLKQKLSNSTDYLASSFGADLPLLRFWNRAEFGTIRLSDKPNAASGLHSALVLHPLTEPATQLWQTAQNRFRHQFPLQLASSLQKLSPSLACELARHTTVTTKMSTPTLEAAVLFAYAARPYESSLSAMHQFAHIALFKPRLGAGLNTTQRHLFVMRALQNQNWNQCAQQLGLSGKAECVQLLRQGAQKILMQYHAHDQIASLKTKFNLLA